MMCGVGGGGLDENQTQKFIEQLTMGLSCLLMLSMLGAWWASALVS